MVAPIPPAWPSKPLVLVVEDDPDVLALLGSHLRRLGCAVTLTASGEEAVEAAARESPELVVVDILLPGMDGREVLDWLRAQPATAGCLVVATTVLDPDEIARPSDGVLAKPFGRRDIERVLVPLLGRLAGAPE